MCGDTSQSEAAEQDSKDAALAFAGPMFNPDDPHADGPGPAFDDGKGFNWGFDLSPEETAKNEAIMNAGIASFLGYDPSVGFGEKGGMGDEWFGISPESGSRGESITSTQQATTFEPAAAPQGATNQAGQLGASGSVVLSSNDPSNPNYIGASPYNENDVSNSGRGGNVGGITGPSGGTGVGGFGGRAAADEALAAYEVAPDAWNETNNAQYDSAFEGTETHEGAMNELSDWAARNGIASITGAGARGMLGTQEGVGRGVMNAVPTAVGFVNPAAGAALSVLNQAIQGNYENAGRGALTTAASMYGGPAAGLGVSMLGSVADGNTRGAATTGISSAINGNQGLSGPAAMGVNALVGDVVSGISSSIGQAGTPGGAVTGEFTGAAEGFHGPTTDGASSSWLAAQQDAAKHAQDGYGDRILNSLKNTTNKSLGYAADNPLSVANGALQLYANYMKSKAPTSTNGAAPKTSAQKMADLRTDPGFRSIDITSTPRTRTAQSGNIKQYGKKTGAHQYFDNVNPTVAYTPRNYAGGGAVVGALQPRTPHGIVRGSGGGQDDLVDARLSPSEYVFDAESVAALGDGNPAEGARKLDAARAALRKHKRRASPSKIPPKARPLKTYLKGGR